MSLIEPGIKAVRPPKNWLERWWSPDPRKAPRELAPGLAAYYWNGAAPKAHAVRDISPTGLYVVTEERWYPGTLVLMTLQRTDDGETDRRAIDLGDVPGSPVGKRWGGTAVHPARRQGCAQREESHDGWGGQEGICAILATAFERERLGGDGLAAASSQPAWQSMASSSRKSKANGAGRENDEDFKRLAQASQNVNTRPEPLDGCKREYCRRRPTGGRRCAALARGEEGGALVEIALTVPVLLGLLTGIMHIWNCVQQPD